MNQLAQIYEVFLNSKGVCIDSRAIQDQQIFFAFRGEHTDGHKYVKKVVENDTCYAVVEDEDYVFNDRCFLVENVLECIQDLAALYRSSFTVPVIALTGSNGKTTTKELIHAVLSSRFKIHATQGNYNNHLGVPLTLLSAPKDSEILLIEMGANKSGDIDELCRIAAPEIGLITNIGNAHLETFGSVQGIIDTKTEIYRFVDSMDGVLFFNERDELLKEYLPSNTENKPYPLAGIDIVDKGLSLEMTYNNKSYSTGLFGIYNAMNIHAALAIGEHFNISIDDCLNAVSLYSPNLNRSQIISLDDLTIIMDAYNANPSSMERSVESLSQLDNGTKKLAILGDMLELGNEEIKFHAEILALAKSGKIAKVITIGPRFKAADSVGQIENFSNTDEFISFYRDQLSVFKGMTILLKASRSMKLENLLSFFNPS